MNRTAVLVLIAALAQGGCLYDPTLSRERMMSDEVAFGPSDRLPDAPLASLPEAAGRVIGVQTVRDGGAVKQRIVLRGDGGTAGENVIEVEARPATAFGGAPSRSLRGDQLEDELARRFPGVAMQVLQQPALAEAGPLGIAVGHAGSSTCIYAWRDPKRTAASERLTVRVRLCRTMSLDRLLALVRQLRGPDAMGFDAEPTTFGDPALHSYLDLPTTGETRWLDPDLAQGSSVIVAPRARAHGHTRAWSAPPRRPLSAPRRRTVAQGGTALQARDVAIPLPSASAVVQASPRKPASLTDLPMPPGSPQ